MKPQEDEFTRDVFVSYSHRDEKWVVNWLIPKLEDAGLSVGTDTRDFRPGSPIISELERVLALSRIILVVLTPAYLSSEWIDYETAMVERLDPTERQLRVSLLMREPCELPMRIRHMTYADFTRPDQVEAQLNRLLARMGVKKSSAPTQRAVTESGTEPREYSPRAIRHLLTDAFADEELTTLCFDYFPSVYQDFTTGMTKWQKVQRLLEFCERHATLGQLLAAVKDMNPAQYSRFEQRIKWE